MILCHGLWALRYVYLIFLRLLILIIRNNYQNIVDNIMGNRLYYG